MFELNLLRKQQIEARQDRKIIRLINISNIAILALFVLSLTQFIPLTSQLSQLNAEQRRLEGDIKGIRTKLLIDEYEKEWKLHADNMHTVQEILRDKSQWSIRLATLMLMKPDEMHIKTLSYDMKNGPELILEALVKTRQGSSNIDEFITAVAADPLFTKEVKIMSRESSAAAQQPSAAFAAADTGAPAHEGMDVQRYLISIKLPQ